MSVDLQETPRATWERRLFARHYPYFDYADLTTLLNYSELTALSSALSNISNSLRTGNTWYQFGTNARAKIVSPTLGTLAADRNWPTGCYGREILLYCDQDAWAQFIVINPEYLKDYTVYMASGKKKAISASQLIYEKEFLVPNGITIRRFLYYGYGIVFRARTVADTLRVWIEASVTGDES